MDRELQWILVLAICASSLINILAENTQLTHWNLANLDYSGMNLHQAFLLHLFEIL